ncbi:MAG TPA: hypothetical protein PK772_04850 [Chitinophagaceae bacterium]|nr:hypothetical protein [Chitinophagaceae bacterium]
MQLLLNIKDDKARFFMELLKNFSYVKVKPITPHKAQVLEELKEAVENLNLVKQGKYKPKLAKDLIDEL